MLLSQLRSAKRQNKTNCFREQIQQANPQYQPQTLIQSKSIDE